MQKLQLPWQDGAEDSFISSIANAAGEVIEENNKKLLENLTSNSAKAESVL